MAVHHCINGDISFLWWIIIFSSTNLEDGGQILVDFDAKWLNWRGLFRRTLRRCEDG